MPLPEPSGARFEDNDYGDDSQDIIQELRQLASRSVPSPELLRDMYTHARGGTLGWRRVALWLRQRGALLWLKRVFHGWATLPQHLSRWAAASRRRPEWALVGLVCLGLVFLLLRDKRAQQAAWQQERTQQATILAAYRDQLRAQQAAWQQERTQQAAASQRQLETVPTADQGTPGSGLLPQTLPVADRDHTVSAEVLLGFPPAAVFFRRSPSLQAPSDIVTEAEQRFTVSWQQREVLSASLQRAAAACEYADIQHRLLNEPTFADDRLQSPAKVAAKQLVLGLLAHRTAALETARRYYESVTRSPEADPETVAVAWFELGVLHARTYQATHERHAQQEAIAALRQSVISARRLSPTRAQAQIELVMHAVTPLEERPPQACDTREHSLEDLTALRTVPNLRDLVAASPL